MTVVKRDPLGVYSRVASVALPVALAALAFLVHKEMTRLPAAQPTAGVSVAEPLADVPVDRAFQTIYKEALWGANAAGKASSGSGSTLESTAVYRAFLQSFLREHAIHSVVDAGCGDWEFSQAMDWSGIDYKGYDVVPSVIAGDKAKFSAANIQFFTADILSEDLPSADLLISKHVLQHLTNADVARFTQLGKYKHVLLTDGVDARTLTSPNIDISRGQYRPLDPTQPPFNVPGLKVLTWWDGLNMHQVVHITPH